MDQKVVLVLQACFQSYSMLAEVKPEEVEMVLIKLKHPLLGMKYRRPPSQMRLQVSLMQLAKNYSLCSRMDHQSRSLQ